MNQRAPTFGQRPQSRSPAAGPLIEGEFAVFEVPPTLSPAVAQEPAPSSAPKRAGAGFWACGALCALLAFWFSGGYSLWPDDPLPSRPAIRGSIALETLGVTTGQLGKPGVVAVEAQARNSGSSPRALPLLAIRLTTKEGERLDYPLPRRNAMLAPGASERFATQIAVDGERFVSAQAVFID